MNFLQQQPKPTPPLFAGALLLLFLFSSAPMLNAQSFYLVKGTVITIDETTTFFTTDSGTVGQARVRNFEKRISEKEEPSNTAKRKTSNPKKFRFRSKKNGEQHVYESSDKEYETGQKTKTEPIALKPCPDYFILANQQGMAIAASVPNIKYSSKFLLQNTALRTLQGYSSHTDYEQTDNGFLFLHDYHLLRHMTRPPPVRHHL